MHPHPMHSSLARLAVALAPLMLVACSAMDLTAGTERTYGSLDAVTAPPCGADVEGGHAPCPPHEHDTFATFEP